MRENQAFKVLVACDKFKGSLAAAEVADAVAEALPADWVVVKCPIADGGEGFVDAMLAGSGGQRISVETLDALGRPCVSEYGVAEVHGRTVAFIEMSAASGLWRIAADERNPRRASTFGTGQMIRHAAEVSRVEVIYIGIGGSATNDGGAGMASALGVRFLDAEGGELDGCPEGLQGLAGIDESRRVDLPEIIVACDVDNPLCGARGASVVFGPQKGASAADVEFLDTLLGRLAEISGGSETAETPGAGAAGGLGFGLMRFAGAKLVSGFEMVAAALDLGENIRNADLVITGEGSLDAQTLGGKGPSGVAAMAKESGVPAVAVAGRVEEVARGLFDAVLSLESFGLPKEESIARAGELVEAIVRRNIGVLEALVKPRR